MYLLDTNIFLEILLSQKKCTDCKKLLNDKICNIFISDFSLHSIGIILFQNDKEDIFANFISDVAARIEIVSLLSESYTFLSEFKEKYGLDFDDAYQCKIAEEQDFTIVTMDKDFKRVKDRIKIEFI